MNISQKLSQRINKIKRGDIQVCNEKFIQLEKLHQFRKELSKVLSSSVKSRRNSINDFKSVNQALFNFKNSLNQEIMRLMMYPEKKLQECYQCERTEILLKTFDNLKLCKDLDRKETGNCLNIDELLKHLLSFSDSLDGEVNSIFKEMKFNDEKESRNERVYLLQSYKVLKNKIEEIIGKFLYSDVGSWRLRNINISMSLKQITENLKLLLNKCLDKCGETCNSCGAKAIKKAKSQLEEYRDMSNRANYVDVRDFVKDNVLDNIENLSDEMKNYKKAEVLNQTTQCEDEQYTASSAIRGLFWSLANITIVSGDEETILYQIDVTVKFLEDKLAKDCETVIESENQVDMDVTDCEEAEYEHASNFISLIDNTLKEAKSGGTALMLGYLDLQSMFNTRVSQLFEGQLCCSEEVQVIKKIYMTQISECWDDLIIEEKKSQKECLTDSRKVLVSRRDVVLKFQIQKGWDKTVRNCPCSCKFAARSGECPPACEKYSANPECCHRASHGDQDKCEEGCEQNKGEELTNETNNNITTLKPPNSNLDKRYRSEDLDFFSDEDVLFDNVTDISDTSLSEDAETNGEDKIVPSDTVDNTNIMTDPDINSPIQPIDSNDGMIDQVFSDPNDSTDIFLDPNPEQIENNFGLSTSTSKTNLVQESSTLIDQSEHNPVSVPTGPLEDNIIETDEELYKPIKPIDTNEDILDEDSSNQNKSMNLLLDTEHDENDFAQNTSTLKPISDVPGTATFLDTINGEATTENKFELSTSTSKSNLVQESSTLMDQNEDNPVSVPSDPLEDNTIETSTLKPISDVPGT